MIVCLNMFWYFVDIKNFFVVFFYYGDLDFKGEEKVEIMLLLVSVFIVVDIYLDCLVVILDIIVFVSVLIVNYGVSD